MLRWGLICFGLVLLIGGIGAMRDYEPAEEGAASSVTMDEAFALVAKGESRFVTIEAELDPTVRFYPTGMAKPQYSTTPPNAVQAVRAEATSSELAALNGCAVDVESFVNPVTVLKVQSVTYREDQSIQDGTINSERFIAPLLTSENRLFVCSPSFRPGSDESTTWLTRQRFSGRLCYLKDLQKNVTSLEDDGASIASYFMQQFGVMPPSDAMVILTDARIDSAASTVYAPIVGSGNGLFVAVGSGDATPSGTISGELLARNGSSYADFARGRGARLPEQIGMLNVQTAEEYNTTKQAAANIGIKYGAMAMIAGIALVGHRHWRKKRVINAAVGRGMSAAALGRGSNDWRRAA